MTIKAPTDWHNDARYKHLHQFNRSGRLMNPNYKVIETVNEQAEGGHNLGIHLKQKTGICIIGEASDHVALTSPRHQMTISWGNMDSVITVGVGVRRTAVWQIQKVIQKTPDILSSKYFEFIFSVANPAKGSSMYILYTT